MDFMHLAIVLNFYFNYLKNRRFKRPLNEMSALSIFNNMTMHCVNKRTFERNH